MGNRKYLNVDDGCKQRRPETNLDEIETLRHTFGSIGYCRLRRRRQYPMLPKVCRRVSISSRFVSGRRCLQPSSTFRYFRFPIQSKPQLSITFNCVLRKVQQAPVHGWPLYTSRSPTLAWTFVRKGEFRCRKIN